MSGQPSPVPPTTTRRVAELRPHPHAGEVPPMRPDQFASFKTDIEKYGVQEPIEITPAGLVLDGNVRLRAAIELGLAEVDVRVVTPEDELEYVLRRALMRRDLTPGQRAALGIKLLPFHELREQATQRQQANLRRGAEVAPAPAREGRSRDLVAKLAGTGSRTAQDVISVHEHDPELFERVLNGEIAARAAASKARRARRDAALSSAPPLPEGPFELLLVDPPWTYGSPDSRLAPEQHYATMNQSELKQLRLPAADDALLFLWSVNARLEDALELCHSWGFSYRSNIAWVKPSIGPGVWLRQRHELLLIASKGTISPAEPEELAESVIEAPRTKHSEKPLQAYEAIEQMYPALSKVELFARGTPRPGWAAWGNESEPTPEGGP